MIILISGAAGQDGVILARRLLGEGHTVIGTCRPGQEDILTRLVPKIQVSALDLTCKTQVVDLLNKWKPNEIYNLAAFSSVRKSWEEPDLCTEINCMLPSMLLDWIRRFSPETKFVQASSSEIFGGATYGPQSESTSLAPITPYGLTKAYSHQLVNQFREEYGLAASNAILYNHESPLRKTEYVTRHVTRSVAKIAIGLIDHLNIGNLDATRDWGWAPDYVEGLILMARSKKPSDYILATGEQHSVGELVDIAFNSLGISSYHSYIRKSENLIRKVDPGHLFGNSDRATQELGWIRTLDFRGIIETMALSDLRTLETGGKYNWLSNL